MFGQNRIEIRKPFDRCERLKIYLTLLGPKSPIGDLHFNGQLRQVLGGLSLTNAEIDQTFSRIMLLVKSFIWLKTLTFVSVFAQVTYR